MTDHNKISDKIPGNATEIILESISDGVFTVDYNWRIMSFNRAAEEITGIPRSEAIGRHCWEVFRSNMCEGDCALRRTMKESKSFVSTSTYIVRSDKKKIPITASTSLLINENGDVLGGVETFRDHSVVEDLRKELSERFQMGDMISRNKMMRKIFGILPQVAESDSTILIEGETGTGKELMARAIHNLSFRKNKPFVEINCGALPDTLLESELFGYKAGAFTNAIKNKPGYFTVANEGTILLDEIGDTSSAFQIKLLRVIEEQQVQPLGSVKKEKVNVRVIASTNKNLSDMVSKGEFRQDLFYRINVVRLKIPALRERMEDIPLLTDHFITKMNRLRDKNITGIDSETLEALMLHDYPGNIRELENLIERAFVLCNEGTIHLKHLPGSFNQKFYSPVQNKSINHAVKAAEITTIIDAMKRNNYNRKAAAENLGMHKSTLFRKIKKLKITLPDIDGRYKNITS
jgi:PAS domain S-box-containing protein